MALTKSYNINGKVVELSMSKSLFVIRTKSQGSPKAEVGSLINSGDFGSIILKDNYPEANVWVYQISKKGKENILALKQKIRSLNSKNIQFIGSVYVDPDTKMYQLYTGNLFLRFSTSCNQSEIKSTLDKFNLKVKMKLGFEKNAYFVKPEQQADEQSSEFIDAFEWSLKLLENEHVVSCQPELVVKRKSFNDLAKQAYIEDSKKDWIAEKINLHKAWEVSKGDGVKICIIDDGIDPFHPAFRNNKIIASRDMLNSSNENASHMFEGEIHGTACAGIASSADPKAWGIAPNSKLIIVRSKGLGSVLEAEAIYWAVQQGADIISCSWGPIDGDIDNPFDDFQSHRMPEHTKLAIEYAVKHGRNGKGCAIFFAAGNGHEPVELDSYASNANVMAIGAVNKENKLTRYSDFGPPLFCVFPSSESSKKNNFYKTEYGVTVPDRLGEPGFSTGDYFSLFGGTSASAPGMAGVAALILSLNPDLSLVELRELLIDSCIQVGEKSKEKQLNYSSEFGYGLINADLAVRNALRFKKNIKQNTMNTDFKKYALHIGVDIASPEAYSNFQNLFGCVNDSKALGKISEAENFNETVYLGNEKATREAIIDQIEQFSDKAVNGDIVFITYAGHGSQVLDVSGDEPMDQVLVTYNGLLLDDEIDLFLCKFKEGVRVIWVADCCHAESNTRLFLDGSGRINRSLSSFIATQHFEKNHSQYSKLKENAGRNFSSPKASICAMYACLKTQYAQEENGRGMFSQMIEDMYHNDQQISLNELESRFSKPLTTSQTPNFEFKGGDRKLFENGLFQSVSSAQNTDSTSVPDDTASTINKSEQNDLVYASGNILVETENENSKLALKTSSVRGDKTLRVLDGEIKGRANKFKSAWDEAHELNDSLQEKENIEFIEPDLSGAIFSNTDENVSRSSSSNEYLSSYPNPEKRDIDNPFIWHLGDEYSQLKKAFEAVKKSFDESGQNKDNLPIICHIDTGIYLNNEKYGDVLPENLDLNASRNFQDVHDSIEDEDKNWTDGVLIENQGHGIGTISILAGGKVPQPNGSSNKVYFGAFPYARVVTLKISENVVILSGKTFAKALRYAVDIVKCDVVSMSMAGIPTRKMLREINYAYDKGVTVVTAGGNSWVKGLKSKLPKTLMYPARFNRVIAATGATPDKTPYLIDENRNHHTKNRETGGDSMQTCYGPQECMSTAIAGYTPNVMWAGKHAHGELYDRSGGGTSSATPQIAAAAAMWLYYHRDELNQITQGKRDWRRVEMVRQALFQSAEKSKFTRFNKVFGNGMLKANDALQIDPSALKSKIKKEAKDNLGIFISDEIYRQFNPKVKNDHTIFRKMLNTEIAQLCMIDPAFNEITESSSIEEIAEAALSSQHASNRLRQLMLRMTEVALPRSLRSSDLNGPRLHLSCQIPDSNINDFHIVSEGCSFELKEVPLKKDQDEEVCYEIIPHNLVEGQRSGQVKINILCPSFVDSEHSILLIEEDEETQTSKHHWIIPNEKDKHPFDDRESFGIEIASDRNAFRKIKKFFVKFYRVVFDKPLSDMPGLIVGKVNENSFQWEGRVDNMSDDLKNEIIKQKRTLFLIHGTLSSASGSFGDLIENPAFFNRLQNLGFGQYVLAYNMSTIISGVSKNAEEVKKKWLPFIKKTNPSIIASSRGCLVARQIFKGEIPMALIAGTHWGTPLASKEHIPAYFNRMSSLASMVFGAGPILSGILKGISFALKMAAKAEGIKNQSEDSAFVKKLNREFPLGPKQMVFGANFEPQSKRWKNFADEVLDRTVFSNRQNDGVNLTSSALGKDTESDLPHTPSFLVPGEETNHFTFFKNPQVLDQIYLHFENVQK